MLAVAGVQKDLIAVEDNKDVGPACVSVRELFALLWGGEVVILLGYCFGGERERGLFGYFWGREEVV